MIIRTFFISSVALISAFGMPGVARADENDGSTTRAIHEEVTVAAPRAEVWKALTTTEGVKTFFAPDANVELRLNGPYEIFFVPSAKLGERGGEGNRVLSYIPEEMLSFTWNAPPKFGAFRAKRTFVVIRLSDAGEGQTRVELTHAGWQEGEQWDQIFDYFAKAWPHVLGNLKKRFGEGPLDWGDEAAGAEHPEMQHFVYFIRPARGDFFETGPTPDEGKLLAGHVRHIQSLDARNILLLAGPCSDPAVYPKAGDKPLPLEMPVPGIVIYTAENMDAARKIMESDPAVAGGVFRACVTPFNLAFMRE